MKTVRLYDVQTRQSREILERELAPGYVKVRDDESGEEAFARATDLKPHPGYRHPPFTGELKQLMADFAEVFKDVFPMTPAQWEDGFRRDLDYEGEIAFWANVGRAFRHFTQGARSWSPAARRDVFNIIVSCFTNGIDTGLECVALTSLSRDQATDIRERLKTEGGK